MNRTDYGFTRKVCACRMCQIPCEHMPACLSPQDIPRIAEHLGYTDLGQFAAENLLASPGMVVIKAGKVIRLPTLVPAKQGNGHCKFYQNNRCAIHPVAPYGCAFMDMHSRYDPEMNALVIDIYEAHTAQGDYHNLWYYLHSLNRLARSPEEGREAVSKALQAEGL